MVYIKHLCLLLAFTALAGCATLQTKEEKRQAALPAPVQLHLGVFEDARDASATQNEVKHDELYVYKPHLILGQLREALPQLVLAEINTLNAAPQDADPNKPAAAFYAHYVLQEVQTKLLKGGILLAALKSRVLVRDSQANIVWQNVLRTEKRQPNTAATATEEQQILATLLRQALGQSLTDAYNNVRETHAAQWVLLQAGQ